MVPRSFWAKLTVAKSRQMAARPSLFISNLLKTGMCKRYHYSKRQVKQQPYSVILSAKQERPAMNAADFRRIALSLEGAEEGSHMGSPDFRVGGRIFATLASQKQGCGNLMLSPEQQAAFVEELPDVF